MAMLTSVRRRRNTNDRALSARLPLQRRAPELGSPLQASSAARPAIGDVAANRPGEAADAQAVLRRDAAPVRTAFARALGVSTDERAWRRGAEGQAKVGAMLAQLDEGWRTLHGLPLGGAVSVDHLVLGPGGVYSLSTRHHPGGSVFVAGDLFMVDGRRYTYIDAARREAVAVSVRLSGICGFRVPVTGVVVPVGVDDFLVKRAPVGVGVTPRARVVRWLDEQVHTLSASEVSDIYAAALTPDVWH